MRLTAQAAVAACGYGHPACGAGDAVLYPEGLRCPAHAPAARAGRPEPDSARYCLAICYCGQCPPGKRDQPLTPITPNVVDFNAIKSGKRRSRSLEEYRQAQSATRRPDGDIPRAAPRRDHTRT